MKRREFTQKLLAFGALIALVPKKLLGIKPQQSFPVSIEQSWGDIVLNKTGERFNGCNILYSQLVESGPEQVESNKKIFWIYGRPSARCVIPGIPDGMPQIDLEMKSALREDVTIIRPSARRPYDYT